MRIAILLLTTVTSLAGAQSRSIDDIHWLVGCWERARPNGKLVERWDAPQGGVMSGIGFSVRDSAVRVNERLRLRFAGDTLIYEARPANQPRAEFRSTSVTASAFVLENPAHDFPQKISYRRIGTDSLHARIEGDRDGKIQPIDYPYRRASADRCVVPSKG